MTEQIEDFRALLQLAKQGDDGALTRLTDRYEPQVRVVARVLLGRGLRADLDSVDLVQSVHRAFLMGLRNDKFNFSTPEQLVKLAITLVHRKVARQWRRRQRLRRIAEGATGRGNLGSLFSSLISTDLDPARLAQAKDQFQRLIQGLADYERQILEMRADGCRMAEIAAALRIQPGNVRMRLMRLRQRLQAEGLSTDWF